MRTTLMRMIFAVVMVATFQMIFENLLWINLSCGFSVEFLLFLLVLFFRPVFRSCSAVDVAVISFGFVLLLSFFFSGENNQSIFASVQTLKQENLINTPYKRKVRE